MGILEEAVQARVRDLLNKSEVNASALARETAKRCAEQEGVDVSLGTIEALRSLGRCKQGQEPAHGQLLTECHNQCKEGVFVTCAAHITFKF